MMSDTKVRWRPRVGSLWWKREDAFQIRYRVIAHEDDEVICERTTDGVIFRRELDFWRDLMDGV